MDKDVNGHLWIGTVVAGAFRYDGKDFTWFSDKILSRLDDGRTPAIRSMIQYSGDYWLSNTIHRFRLDDDGGYTTLSGIDLNVHDVDIRLPYFMSSLVDEHDNLWMSSYSNGIWKWDGRDLIQMHPFIGDTRANSMVIYQDNDNQIWVGTDNLGVFMYNGTTFESYKFNE